MAPMFDRESASDIDFGHGESSLATCDTRCHKLMAYSRHPVLFGGKGGIGMETITTTQDGTAPPMGVPQPGAGFVLMPDEVTLHLIASGLILLAQQARAQATLLLPYPPSLQRGLNRLILACLRRGRQPPQGLMDLLAWCRQPLSCWELELPEGSIAGESARRSNSDGNLRGMGTHRGRY